MLVGVEHAGERWARATEVLARRHERSLIVVDAPAGHGRAAVLRRAASTPIAGVTDVVVAAPAGPMGAAAFAGAAAAALGHASPPPSSSPPVEHLRAAIARAVEADGGQVVLLVDDLHRAGPEVVELVGEVARSLPLGAHLVVGGAGLGRLGAGPLLAEGLAERIGVEVLGGPDVLDDALVLDLLADARTLDVTDAARQLLDVVVALDVRRTDAVAAIAEVLELTAPADASDLARLPLVVVGSTHLVLDDRWRGTCAEPSPEALARAASAAGQVALAGGELDEAGRLALVAHDASLLRLVVRSALASQPPRVGAHDLRSWDESAILDPEEPHAWWLDAACRSVHGAALRDVFDRYGRAGAAFRAAGDRDAEIAVGSAAAIIARRLDDLGSLVAFIGRAGELLAEGHEPAEGPALLGEALVWQMGGDPTAALATLDRLPHDAFDGDWAAQVAMMRGTNLALLGRIPEAIAQLSAATGWSGAWSSARALDLLAMVRWRAGDPVGAFDDLTAAIDLATSAGASDLAASARATRAAMLALHGRDGGPSDEEVAPTAALLDDESRRVLAVAHAVDAVVDGDVEGALRLLREVPSAPRAVPSTHWILAIEVALDPAATSRWEDVVSAHPALQSPLAAGLAGAQHLRDGEPAPLEHRPFLPARWCERSVPVVELDLVGRAEVRLDGVPVAARSWERARVRELAVRLALVGPSPREQVAADLWPDLESAAAAKNLRVTLTYLLDVLDPDRAKGEGSELVVDRGGSLALVDAPRLRIDLRDVLRDAAAILEADARGEDPAAVASARRLARRGDGPLLGGAALGEWVDPHERERVTLLLRSLAAGGRAALRVGDPVLAEDLGRRGLRLDPWAERLHQLVVRACLARDDLDAARRELRHAVATLAELGVRPEPATWALARQVGIRLDAGLAASGRAAGGG